MNMKFEGRIEGKVLIVQDKENDDFSIGIPSLEKEGYSTYTNKANLIWYLEELEENDELSERELEIFDKYTYGDKVTSREWVFIYKKMMIYENGGM